MAARLSAAARSIHNDEAEATLMGGCVGTGAIREYLLWREELDLPDPEELLANPTKYKHPVRGDRAFAILASVVAAFLRKPTLRSVRSTLAS